MKKMKKRVAALLLQSALVISLTGCNTNSSATIDATTPAPAITPTVSTPDTEPISESSPDVPATETYKEPTAETTTPETTTDKETTTEKEETTEKDASTQTNQATQKETSTEKEETTQTSPEKSTKKETATEETTSKETSPETSPEKDPSPESPSAEATEDETTTAVTPTTAAPTTAQPTTAQATKAPTTAAKKETTTAGTTAAVVKPVSISASVTGTHYGGETLTGADFNVTVKFSDGTAVTNPAGFTASPLTLVTGSNSIVVAYNSVSTTITVNAKEKATAAPTTAAPTTAAAQPTTAAPTTAAAQPTTAAPTTAAPTTAAPAETTPEFSEPWRLVSTTMQVPERIADYGFSKKAGMACFDAQNAGRVEAGVPLLTWSDELYEVAMKCAKACGDAGYISHDLTDQYCIYWDTEYGVEDEYAENLVRTGYDAAQDCILLGGLQLDYWDDGIALSKGHYRTAVASSITCGAVAVYRVDQWLFISAIYY